MGLGDVTLFLVVAVTGVRWIATAAAIGPAALTLWVIGFFALFVPLAFTVIELSSRYPDEGGLYVWTRRAFGEYAGFIAGWMYLTTNLSFFPGQLYFAAASALFAFGASALSASVPYFLTASLVGLALALGLNLAGLRVGKWLHNAGGWASWIPIALLVAVAAIVCARFGPATPITPAALIPGANLSNLILCSTIAFAFCGLEAAPLMAEEIENPRRTIPRAILWSGVIVTATYLLGTLAVLLAIPAKEVSALAGIMQATGRAADRIGASALTPIAALLMAVGSLGSVGAWLASVGRLTYVSGVDRYLPASFGRVHPRFQVPHVALLAQAIGAALFIVLSQLGTSVGGAYEVLVALTAITYFIPLMLMFAAMIALQREPAVPGTFRTPGGRPVAVLMGVLGFTTTAVAMVLAAWPPADSPNPTLSVLKIVVGTAVTLGVGTLLYRRGARSPASPASPHTAAS
jgi:amino acid transporter